MMSDWRTNQGDGTAVLERRSAAAERSWSAVVEEEIWSSVDEIDVAAWEQVREQGDLFLDLRLLQAVETSMAATCRFRYVLYRDAEGEPAAIAVLCTFTIDIGVLADDAWSRWALRGLRRISRKLVDYRILFCGLPLSACQSSLRFAPGADSRAILQRLDGALRRIGKQDRASVIVLKEFADEELPPLKPLEALGYRKADSLPTHLVALHSESFDGFLKDMTSKRRANVRMSLKKFAGKGVEFITTSDYATIERLFTPETYRLYEEVLGRSETKLEHLPREFFLEMARRLPDCCEFTFAVEGERVIAFCISLWNDHEYRGLFIGYDASRNQDLDLYFNLAFRTIAEAAFHRSAVVEVGQNSSYFKRTKLGAIQSRRSLYVRGGNVVMNGVIGLLFKQLFPPRPLAGEGEGR